MQTLQCLDEVELNSCYTEGTSIDTAACQRRWKPKFINIARHDLSCVYYRDQADDNTVQCV